MIARLLPIVIAIVLPVWGQASSLEREILGEINLARTQPQLYAGFIEARVPTFRGSEGPAAVREAAEFLRKAKPVEPMEWSGGMQRAALRHAEDLGARGARGHRGADGTMPWHRLADVGRYRGHVAENIDYGNADARTIVISLLIGNGTPQRYHRKNLLSRHHAVTGIAVARHAKARSVCVMKFASGFAEAGTELADARRVGFRSEYSGRSFF